MPRLRRDLLELVDVIIPESIEVGKRYTAKLKIKNTATLQPTIYRYNYTVEGEKEVEVMGSSDTVIKGGEELEIEIERIAKKEKEHWEVKVFRGVTPKNTVTDPQFVEEFDVPKEVPAPPGIAITDFEITSPVEKEIYAGGEFTGKTTIKNIKEETLTLDKVTVKILQNSMNLGEVIFENIELEPGGELSKEVVFTEKSRKSGEYEVCAVL